MGRIENGRERAEVHRQARGRQRILARDWRMNRALIEEALDQAFEHPAIILQLPRSQSSHHQMFPGQWWQGIQRKS